MLRISLSAFLIAIVALSCKQNLRSGDDSKASVSLSCADENLKTEYRDLIPGKWSWTPSPRYSLVFRGGRAVFLTDGKPDFQIAGRAEVDSAFWSLSETNCNAKAPYYKMARQLIHGKMSFLSLQTPITRGRTKKRCFAIMELGTDRMKLMDTDNGTVLEYAKEK
jgi:hypothetical protein